MTSSPLTRIGDLKQYASLQTKTLTPDGAGGFSTVWATARAIWCDIHPTSGSQRLEGDQRESVADHQITVRYQADVDPVTLPEKRIVFGTEVFNILTAWRLREVDEYVRMLAKRGVAT